MEILANATQLGFTEINEQLQAMTKMTLQNRLASDLLLLYEHGVCGYLNLNNTCVHILNATAKLDDQVERIKSVAASSRELRAGLESNWLNKIFQGFEFSLTGWLASHLQSIIVTIVIIVIMLLALSCIKNMIVNATRGTYMMLVKKQSEA